MEQQKSILDIAKDKKRVFDQMATMHFSLADRYKFWSTVEDVIEIVFSVILCGVTFIDGNLLGLTENTCKLILGFASIGLFTFTLIKQRLDHKQKSEKHNLSGKMYAQAKLDISNRIAIWTSKQTNPTIIDKYLSENYLALNALPQIPEKEFSKLKHMHQSKVAFSKYLDEHPKDFYLICRIRFRLSVICKEKTQ